ncbi:hypothetical protein OG311_14385 [Streptomyces sp. NBC_01343]|uniref:hypothetical protein n=1 Tax=Streptomyces sp. NBC_01343 TaxID=2903832 RepID=UPI002E15BE76|nr:hypothetical protein OG311_14385 [Streptomyces sp. NBC_01343]
MKSQVKKAVVLVGMLLAVALGHVGQLGSAPVSDVAAVGGEPASVLRTEIGWP